MKHVRTFENTEEEYTIITYVDNNLAVSVKHKNDILMPYPFQMINNFDDKLFIIKKYTESEAKQDIKLIDKYYNDGRIEPYTFEIVTMKKLEILINASKYNL